MIFVVRALFQIVQRDQLTSFLYKTGSEINIVNKKFSLLDDSNRQRAAELGAVQELNQEQVRACNMGHSNGLVG